MRLESVTVRGAETAPLTHAWFRLVLLVILPLRHSGSADLPNHACPGNLDERRRAIREATRKGRVGGAIQLFRLAEPTVRIGLPEITHRAVVDEIRALVGAELQVLLPVCHWPSRTRSPPRGRQAPHRA